MSHGDLHSQLRVDQLDSLGLASALDLSGSAGEEVRVCSSGRSKLRPYHLLVMITFLIPRVLILPPFLLQWLRYVPLFSLALKKALRI